MTAREIQKMDYGTPEQIKMADLWYSDFMRFSASHPILSENAWSKIHSKDVWYIARHRYFEKLSK